MIQWPWVSRLALDLVTSERDRLRVQNERLLENLLRLHRFEAGMSEVPRQQRKVDVTPMPPALAEHYAGFYNKQMGKMLRAQAYRAHGRGKSWAEIQRDAMEEEEAPQQEPAGT